MINEPELLKVSSSSGSIVADHFALVADEDFVSINKFAVNAVTANNETRQPIFSPVRHP